MKRQQDQRPLQHYGNDRQSDDWEVGGQGVGDCAFQVIEDGSSSRTA